MKREDDRRSVTVKSVSTRSCARSFVRYDFAESALAKKTNRSDRQELAAISDADTPQPPLASIHTSFSRSSLSGFTYCNLQVFSVNDEKVRPSLASLAFVANQMLHENS